jgi:hypothetical protein
MYDARAAAKWDGEEARRLLAAGREQTPWRKWGPYLSERQWGTVREDYSANGEPWTYFPHDHARSRAYRWGEDGLAGFSDDQQRLCFALALWNGRDPILKERLFGLTNAEGNHGEDVKEYYFYLDSTPTHSYMKWLYKYPQRPYPYADLVATSRRRSRRECEYELLDTGLFDNNKYFDVFVEYAKAAPEDILIRVTAINRGSEAARLDVLPTLWFRNTWHSSPGATKPMLREISTGCRAVAASHPDLGERWLFIEGTPRVLFTENETNNARLFGTPNVSAYVKDAIDDFVVHGCTAAVNPSGTGTKAAVHFKMMVPPSETVVVRLRLSDVEPAEIRDPFLRFEHVFEARIHEAAEFYHSITPRSVGADAASTLRQALAGMLWTKQYYWFDVKRWLAEHGVDSFDGRVRRIRDDNWAHMVNADVISLPDKWEYPWFASWPLPFHAVALGAVDVTYAKAQLELMLGPAYLHPSGQVPASEWNFSNVNPPVHAWAAIVLYRVQQILHGRSDVDFLKRVFGKLLPYYTWWVNRRDRFGKTVFEGGFLGIDDIGVLERPGRISSGGDLELADGALWMALFCQNMLEIGIEIASTDATFEDLTAAFIDHFFGIATAINCVGRIGMWDDEDGFYYDVVRLPDGTASRLKVRSMVGLLPLCATAIIEAHQRSRIKTLEAHFEHGIRRQPNLLGAVHPAGENHRGYGGRGMFALVDRERLHRILVRLLDEREFLSPFGIRTLSRIHAAHPWVLRAGTNEYCIRYRPAESDTAMLAGNASWQGPIWMPVNVLLIRALLQCYAFYGDTFTVECPTGSGRTMSLFEVAREIATRVTRIFLRDANGRRPIFGGTEKFQNDPNWRDCLLFYEYFHGDNGAGLGASHQTGWTGLVATLIQLFWTLDARDVLEGGVHEVHVPAHEMAEMTTRREPAIR